MGRVIYDWQAVQRFADQGNGFVECQRRFGFSHTAWVKALQRGELHVGEPPFRDRRRRYDWSAVQAYYDEGHSYRECRVHFGFCAAAWTKAVERGEILPRRSIGMPVEELLADPERCRNHVKSRLLRAGLLENRCSACGLTEWQGQPLTIHLDHINGARSDHRLENLRMLCPNCHSQTPTYAGRNNRSRKRLHDRGSSV